MFQKQIEGLVSIIVPVYNEYDYIDECMASLVKQTYKNIEIILINDGSPDDSALKCIEWQKKDDRIIFVSKKNERLGPSRNLGVHLAKGKYLMFVDADDYVAETFVEKMYNKISEYDADVGFCDYYKVKGDLKIPLYAICNIKKAVNFENSRDLLIALHGTTWCQILKKSFVVQNDIRYRDIVPEDWEVKAPIIMLANKIVQVKEPLYYYRVGRGGSIITEQLEKVYTSYDDSIRYVISWLKDINLYERYKEEIKDFVVDGYVNRFYLQEEGGAKGEVAIAAKKKVENTITEYFADWNNPKTVVLLGSPAIRERVKPISPLSNYYSKKYVKRYNFTSLISIFAPKVLGDVQGVVCKNSYREKMVLNDINKTFLTDGTGDCIIIDFLDERYDLACYEDTYYSMSGDFIRSDFAKKLDYHILPRNDAKVHKIWEESCLKLIEVLKASYSPENIYLCRNYASEEMEDYDCSMDVSELNSLLKKYYSFFESHMAKINVMD